MLWKHRKSWLFILCALSAFLLSMQYTGYVKERVSPQETIFYYPDSTTMVPTTSPQMLPGTEPTCFFNTEYAGESSDRSADTDTAHTGVPETDSGSVEAQVVKKRSLEPYVNAFCLVAGIVMAGMYIFSRQIAPFWGPEADLLGCVLAVRALLFWTRFYPGIQIQIFSVVSVMVLLTSIRGLFWWIFGKTPLGWSPVERTAVFASKGAGKRGYVSVHLLACIAWTFCAAWLGLYGYLWEAAPFALGILLSFLCCRRFTNQVEHLQKQIRNLHENSSIEVEDGMFAESAQQLSLLRERMEEAVRTAVTGERFKVELISNVSHDLRTPLTAILGYGELLNREQLSEEGQRQLQKLNQKASYMRELVDSVFELTKVSSGAVAANVERIDLIRLLEQTLGLFDDELKSAGLQVRRHYYCDELFLMTDGSRLHQVFANLIGNAVKYALPGSRVHLHVAQEGDITSVRMTNISAYEMNFSPEEILQRFVRGDKARSSVGNGIGLAIAQTYTQSVGGSFRVEIDGEQFGAIVELPCERKM